MTDILERLLDPRFDGPLNAEASREIERLRAIVDNLPRQKARRKQGKRTLVKGPDSRLTCAYEVEYDQLTGAAACGKRAYAKWEWGEGWMIVCNEHDRVVAETESEGSDERN